MRRCRAFTLIEIIIAVAILNTILQSALVGVDQSRQVHRGLLPTPRGKNERGRFGDVGCHRNGNAAEDLDALGKGIDQRLLLIVMGVAQQVQPV